MLGIMSAIKEEQDGLLLLLEDRATWEKGGRTFHTGVLWGTRVLLALSGIGKVAAATTATVMVSNFVVDRMLFLGVAGGVGEGVSVGDAVVARSFIQHDMNGAPLFPRHEIPLYQKSLFNTDATMRSRLRIAAARALTHQLKTYPTSKVHIGLILTGDQFISDEKGVLELRHRFEGYGMAVEMEGAAVAQVCHDFDIPYGAVRHISDKADGDAAISFEEFVKATAQFTMDLVKYYLTAKG